MLGSTELPPDVLVFEALVFNGSHRPIRDVACRIELAPGVSLHESDFVGQGISTMDPGWQVRLARAGETWGFIFQHELKDYPDAQITLHFTDDAGLHWAIDPDLHLEKLDSRDDW